MPSRHDIQQWLIAQIAHELGIAPDSVNPDDAFDTLGLGSLQAVGVSGDLEVWLSRTLSPTLLWEYPSIALLAAFLAGETATDFGAAPAAATHEPVAVIGMGCRLPGADNPAAYWRLLSEGLDAVSEVPVDRWDVDAYYDPDPGERGKMNTRSGGFLKDIAGFDPQFFGISQTEADRMDPQQRLLMETAWEALEDAAIAPDTLAGSRTGVYVGISVGDYAAFQLTDARWADAYAGSGNAFSIAANRISYFLDLRGPSMAIDTACSSSLVALHQACAALYSGEASLALAAGVNMLLRPEITVAFSQARMMAADGRCKTFDAAADGYVRGEGCGVVVLKPLSRAIADGDRIHAIIRATAVNHDGRTNGLTAPNGLSQRAVIETALSRAGLSGADIGYVEAHGTGTPLGDPIEMDAIKAAYGKDRQTPLYVGSAKTNIGHLESAAGIAGLIKCVMQLCHRRIVPHLHFRVLNPNIELAGADIVIPVSAVEWPSVGPRRAAVSSFGFGGTNAHAILEEAPPMPTRAESPDARLQLYAISARSSDARDAAITAHAAFAAESGVRLEDLCFTTLAGRRHFMYRAAVAARNLDELRDALSDSRRIVKGQAAAPAKGIAFLFTGQGAQYVGMGRGLYGSEPAFRAALDRCAALLASELDKSLLEVMFDGDAALNETGYTQPALFAIEYAIAALWRHYGVEPAAVIGHSVGEIAAACVAGAFSLEDALRLVVRRAALMQALPEGGGMLAVLADAASIDAEIAPYAQTVSIAAINAPDSTVIAGDSAALQHIATALKLRGIASKPLTVSHAFHSPLMAPMLADFRAVAESITYTPLRLPLASCLAGTVLPAGHKFDAGYWCEHVMRPVRFLEGVAALSVEGPWSYLEVGPAPTLSALGKRCLGAGAIFTHTLQRNEDAEQSFAKAFAALYVSGAPVDWLARYASGAARRTALPTYAFQRSRCWFEPPVDSIDVAPEPRISSGDSHWLYEVEWMPFAPTAAGPLQGGVLLFADSGAVSDALADAFSRDGGVVHRAAPRQPDAQDYARLLKQLPALPRHLVFVVHEAPMYAPAAACLELLHLAQAIEALYPAVGRNAEARLWILTQGGQSLTGESCEPGQAAAWGFGRALFAERYELQGGLVDIDADDVMGSARALLAVMTDAAHEEQTIVRGDMVYAARLRRAPLAAASPPPAFRRDAAYLITGGLGALGLATARALAEAGAGHIVLLARTRLPERISWDALGTASPEAIRTQAIREIESLGAQVSTGSLDVADADALNAFLGDWMRGGKPRIRGVFHAAGAAKDALIDQMDAALLEAVFDAKARGAWNLHQVCGADSDIDYFVLYSSAAAVLGSPGQANYAAANAWLDGLARYRAAQGLPALSVAWGPWAEVGMAAEGGTAKRLEELGLKGLPPRAAATLLLRLLAENRTNVAVLDADWERMARHVLGSARRHLLSGLVANRVSASAASLPGRVPASESIEALLRRLIAQALAAEEESIAIESNIFELGIDSLRVIELIHNIELALHLKLYPKEFIDRPTIAGMASYIHGELSGTAPVALAPSVGTGGELTVTTRRDLRPLPAVHQKNPPMLFVLSGPRSGSTLFRVMLAGHPDLFCPPELHLLQFDTMRERETKLGTSYLAEGLQRAFMEAEGVDAEAAAAIVRGFTERDASTQEVYLRLQRATHPRLLVDKSPSYASAMDTLLRAEVLFDRPLYIHLSRHPYAMIESFVRNRFDRFVYEGSGDALAQGEDVWAVTNCNAIDFLREIGNARGHWVRYEDVVGSPEKAMRAVSAFLKLPYHEATIRPYDGDRMTDGVHKESFAIGDPNFLKHTRIDPALGQTWRTIRLGRRLNGFTRRIAAELGYELPNEDAAGALRSARFEQVAPVQPQGELPPLYIAAPGTGLVYLFHTLADHLNADQPAFALQDPALQTGHPPFESIEALAAAHVAAIRAHRPHGPYYLAGWSFGGVVAFEIGRQLLASGADVGGVIIIDADSRISARPVDGNGPGERLARLGLVLKGMRDVSGYVRDGIVMTAESLRARQESGEALSLAERVQLGWAEALSAWLLDGDARMEGVMGNGKASRAALMRVPLLQRALKNLRANMRALKRYRPEPISAPLVLLRAEENLRLHPNQHLEDLGWGNLAAGTFRVELIPGNHMSLFSDAYIATTAAAIDASLLRLRAEADLFKKITTDVRV